MHLTAQRHSTIIDNELYRKGKWIGMEICCEVNLGGGRIIAAREGGSIAYAGSMEGRLLDRWHAQLCERIFCQRVKFTHGCIRNSTRRSAMGRIPSRIAGQLFTPKGGAEVVRGIDIPLFSRYCANRFWYFRGWLLSNHISRNNRYGRIIVVQSNLKRFRNFIYIYIFYHDDLRNVSLDVSRELIGYR